MYADSLEQGLLATRIVKAIEEAEELVGHEHSLLIGDLNMNPFEAGTIAADCLHGVMDRKIAESRDRQVLGQRKKFFYNPMWKYYGPQLHIETSPPATYYYDKNRVRELFWYMFDQVMVGPEIADRLLENELQILCYADNQSLIKERGGIPDKTDASDHLPILFKLNLYE